MEEKINGIKIGVTAFLSAMGAILGWKGIMLIIWIIAMALDYLSGTAAAAKNGEWSSTTARQGLWHKGGMILVVIVAALADTLFAYMLPKIPFIAVSLKNPGFLLPLVLAWYIITEAGSVLENAVKMGAKVPKWFTRILKASLGAVDNAGNAESGEDDNDGN